MIIKAALLLFRETDTKKELLFVKAFDKPHLIFPGGKQELGETIEAALDRELMEELRVKAKDVRKLGAVEGATPDGRALQMHLYLAQLIGEPLPSAEIESIVWMSRDAALQQKELMTPMTLDHVFPFLDEQKLW